MPGTLIGLPHGKHPCRASPLLSVLLTRSASSRLPAPHLPVVCTPQHYSWFFFGIAEVSSCFLVYVDLFRQCPGLLTTRPGGKLLSTFNELSRAAFGLTFLPIRCVLWPLIVLSLLRDIIAAHAAADARLYYPAAAYHLTTSVLMTLLQQYWGSKVLRGIMKMIQGDKSERAKEN